jgi:DNA-binding transcriptional LysR family regulator
MGMQLAAACDALMLCPQTIMHTLPVGSLSIYPLAEEQFNRTLCVGYRHDTYLSRYMKDFIELTKACILENLGETA